MVISLVISRATVNQNSTVLLKNRKTTSLLIQSARRDVCQPTFERVNSHGASRYVIAHCCAIVTLGCPPDAPGTDGERRGPEKFDSWPIVESRRVLNLRQSRSNNSTR